ncbi:MAG: hypothetical protein ACREFK_03700 [Stellaceae bacterium]
MILAERTLQQEITVRLSCGRWPLIALPIPNGLWIPARGEVERRMVCRLVARMKTDGMLVPGAPDLALFWHGGGAMVELKRPKARDLLGRTLPAGRPSAAQSELAERAHKLGINHAFVSSWDELRRCLAEWGAA